MKGDLDPPMITLNSPKHWVILGTVPGFVGSELWDQVLSNQVVLYYWNRSSSKMTILLLNSVTWAVGLKRLGKIYEFWKSMTYVKLLNSFKMYLGKGAWIVKYARREEPFIVTKNMYVYMYTYKFTMPHVLFFLPLPKHMRGIYKQKDTYRSCRHKQIGGRRMYQNSGSKFSYTTSWLS